MVNVLKLLALPALFILPWLLLKLSQQETGLWERITGQPLLTAALLVPGIILVLMYFIKPLTKLH